MQIEPQGRLFLCSIEHIKELVITFHWSRNDAYFEWEGSLYV